MAVDEQVFLDIPVKKVSTASVKSLSEVHLKSWVVMKN